MGLRAHRQSVVALPAGYSGCRCWKMSPLPAGLLGDVHRPSPLQALGLWHLRCSLPGLQAVAMSPGDASGLLPTFPPMPVLCGRSQSALVEPRMLGQHHRQSKPHCRCWGLAGLRCLVTELALRSAGGAGRRHLLSLPGSRAPGRAVRMVTGPRTSHVAAVWASPVLPTLLKSGSFPSGVSPDNPILVDLPMVCKPHVNPPLARPLKPNGDGGSGLSQIWI